MHFTRAVKALWLLYQESNGWTFTRIVQAIMATRNGMGGLLQGCTAVVGHPGVARITSLAKQDIL